MVAQIMTFNLHIISKPLKVFCRHEGLKNLANDVLELSFDYYPYIVSNSSGAFWLAVQYCFGKVFPV